MTVEARGRRAVSSVEPSSRRQAKRSPAQSTRSVASWGSPIAAANRAAGTCAARRRLVRLLTGSSSEATLETKTQTRMYGRAGTSSRCTAATTSGVRMTAVVSSESTMVISDPSTSTLPRSPAPLRAERAASTAAHSKNPLASSRAERRSSASRKRRASRATRTSAQTWAGCTSPRASATAAAAQVHHPAAMPRGRIITATSVEANRTRVRRVRTDGNGPAHPSLDRPRAV